MNVLKISTLVFILFILILFSCKKDPTIIPEMDELYTPYLTSKRDNGKVTLKWVKPGCEYCGGCICPKLTPSHFDILISKTAPSELIVHAKVSNNIFEVTLNNLSNGTPYYFAVKAVGDNGKFTVSKTIMTIPENPEKIQTIFQSITENSELGSWSFDEKSIAYMGDYTWNNGNNSAKSVLIQTLSTNEKTLVEKNSYSPEWSPVAQKIAYHTDNGEVNTSQGYRPNHIAVYNKQDTTIKRLTGGNSFNFRPTWSPDGNWIAFLSDKAGGGEYNLWKVPADSGTALQLTSDYGDLNDVWSLSDRSPQKPTWSKDGQYITFARLSKEKRVYDIYSVPTNGGSKTTVVTSQWNDHSPTYSPDGLIMAFVSDRSGIDEIWTVNLQTKEIKQVTGSNSNGVYASGGKIEWSPSGSKILYTSGYDYMFTLFTVDVN